MTVEYLSEVAFKFLDRIRLISVEIFNCAFDALTTAEPRFHQRIARPNVKRIRILGSFCNYSDRIGLGKAGQIPKI